MEAISIINLNKLKLVSDKLLNGYWDTKCVEGMFVVWFGGWGIGGFNGKEWSNGWG